MELRLLNECLLNKLFKKRIFYIYQNGDKRYTVYLKISEYMRFQVVIQ